MHDRACQRARWRTTTLGGSPSSELLDLIRPPGWHRDALCREPAYDPAWWFPRGRPINQERIAELAREVCRRCLVQENCLAHALADPGLVGVWGGTTERDRARMRKLRSA